MSEGNLPRNPAENASGLQNDRKRQELLRDQAQKKFSTIDVGGDGKSNGKDHEYRQEALNFITKECLGLPNERFKELVEKIAEILKRKDLEKERLSAEFARARAEIMKNAWNAPLLKDAEAILSLNRGTHLMSRIWNNPEMLARIYVEWGKHHPAYEEIKKMPGGNDAIQAFDQAKMSIEANYRLSRFDAEIQKNPAGAIPKMVKEIVAAKERAKSRVEMERILEQAVNVRFWPPLSAKAVAESLAFAATNSDPKHLEKKLARAETDPKFVSMLVCDWHVRNEIASQLRSMGQGGASALKTMASLRDKWIVKIGIPTAIPATPEQRAKVEAAAMTESKTLNAVRILKETCEESSQKLSAIWSKCEKFGDDAKRVSEMKSEAVKHVNETINPGIGRIYGEIELHPEWSKERRDLESVLLELRKRKLAVDILFATNFEKGQTWTARLLASLTSEDGYRKWMNIQKEREARSDSFHRNLNPDQKMSIPTFDTSKWGNVAMSIEQIEKDLKASAVRDVSYHTFSWYLSALYSLGMLTPGRLKNAFWDRMQDAALHFGFKDDGTVDRDFGKSVALKNMLASGDKDKLWAAERFKEALAQSIREQVNKERLEKAGGYPQLREYVRKKMAGKPAAEADRVFENLKSDIEKAKDGFEILVALRKHLGSDIRDKASLDAFFDEVTKCVVKDRRTKENLVESDMRNAIPKGVRLKTLRVNPVSLKLPAWSQEAKNLEALMEKRFDAGMDDLTPEEETKIAAIIRKALENPAIPKEDREHFENLVRILEIRTKHKKERRKTDGTEASLLYDDTREKMRAGTNPKATPEEIAKAKEAVSIGADAIAKERDLLRAKERADIDVPQKDRDEVFKRLWYSSEAEVLNDDEKTVAAWQLLIKIEDTDIKNLKGFATVRNVLEKRFESAIIRVLANKWESGYVDFMLKATEKADLRNEATIRKLVEEGKLGKIYLDGASQNAWGNVVEQRWTRSFFEWNFETADTGGFLKNLAVGEKVRISDGYSIAKTPTGVEFRTPEGKWRADGKEAVSAVSVAKSLHEAGADFLISSIPSIASAAGVWIKDGTFSSSEERKTLSFMAEFFGIKGYDHSETDLAAVRSNFSKCLVSEGKTLVSKARDIGIMGDSGNLERLKFQDRLSQFETWKWKTRAEAVPFA